MSQKSPFQSTENPSQGDYSSPKCSTYFTLSVRRGKMSQKSLFQSTENPSQVDGKAPDRTPLPTLPPTLPPTLLPTGHKNTCTVKKCPNFRDLNSDVCRQHQGRRDWLRSRYKKRGRSGQCAQCGKPLAAENWQTSCEPCRKREADCKKKTRMARETAGACTRCLNPTTLGFTRCDKCRQKSREHYHRKVRARKLAEASDLALETDTGDLSNTLIVGEADETAAEREARYNLGRIP